MHDWQKTVGTELLVMQNWELVVGNRFGGEAVTEEVSNHFFFLNFTSNFKPEFLLIYMVDPLYCIEYFH